MITYSITVLIDLKCSPRWRSRTRIKANDTEGKILLPSTREPYERQPKRSWSPSCILTRRKALSLYFRADFLERYALYLTRTLSNGRRMARGRKTTLLGIRGSERATLHVEWSAWKNADADRTVPTEQSAESVDTTNDRYVQYLSSPRLTICRGLPASTLFLCTLPNSRTMGHYDI